jgi:predicted nucleic acid-binding protein
MIVVDASAVLEILGQTNIGIELEATLLDVELHAPHLIDLEVLNAVRRWERCGDIRPDEAGKILKAFSSLRITRHPHTPLLDRVWSLRHNLTAYDASYLVLARFLGAELVTMDSALRKMAAPHKPN